MEGLWMDGISWSSLRSMAPTPNPFVKEELLKSSPSQGEDLEAGALGQGIGMITETGITEGEAAAVAETGMIATAIVIEKEILGVGVGARV